MRQIRIIIAGAPGAGKSTFAKLLAARLPITSMAERTRDPVPPSSARSTPSWPSTWRIGECSAGIVARASRQLAQLPGAMKDKPENWAAYICEHKALYRPYLLAVGEQLAQDAPGILLTERMLQAEILVGPRRRTEIAALIDWMRRTRWAEYTGSRLALIHIERPGPVVAEDGFELDYFERLITCEAQEAGAFSLAENIMNTGVTSLETHADVVARKIEETYGG